MPRTFTTSSMNNNVPAHNTNFGKHSPKKSSSALDQPLSNYTRNVKPCKQHHKKPAPAPTAKSYTSKRPVRIHAQPRIERISLDKMSQFSNFYNYPNGIHNDIYGRTHAQLPDKNSFAAILPLVRINGSLYVLMNLEKRKDSFREFLHFPAGKPDTSDLDMKDTAIRELKEETGIIADRNSVFEVYNQTWIPEGAVDESRVAFYITPFTENFETYGFNERKQQDGDRTNSLIEVFGNRLVRLSSVLNAIQFNRSDLTVLATPHNDERSYPLKRYHVNEPDIILASLDQVYETFKR